MIQWTEADFLPNEKCLIHIHTTLCYHTSISISPFNAFLNFFFFLTQSFTLAFYFPRGLLSLLNFSTFGGFVLKMVLKAWGLKGEWMSLLLNCPWRTVCEHGMHGMRGREITCERPSYRKRGSTKEREEREEREEIKSKESEKTWERRRWGEKGGRECVKTGRFRE